MRTPPLLLTAMLLAFNIHGEVALAQSSGSPICDQVLQIELDPVDAALLPLAVDFHHPDCPDVQPVACDQPYCMIEGPAGATVFIRAAADSPPAVWGGCDEAGTDICVKQMLNGDTVVTARLQSCGDAVCEGDEGPGSCPADCDPYSDQRCPRTADYSRALVATEHDGGWRVTAGRNELTTDPSLGNWNVQTLDCSGALPSQFDVAVDITSGEDHSRRNGCVIYDYVAADDFKYACAFFNYDRVLVGHRDASSFWGAGYQWVTANLGEVARLRVSVDGAVATIYADDVELAAHDYGTGGLNEGVLGLGSAYSDAAFDDLAIVERDPCPSSTSFDSGTGAFEASLDEWTVGGGTISSTSDSGWQLAPLECGREMPARYTVETPFFGSIRGWLNGCLVFDYRGPDTFKYACNYGPRKLIGEARPGTSPPYHDILAYELDTEPIEAGALARLEVEGQTATLWVGGVERVAHDFGGTLGGGHAGVGQFGGEGSYGPVSVRTPGTLQEVTDQWAYAHIRNHHRLSQSGLCSVVDDPVDPVHDPADYALTFSTRRENASWGWTSTWSEAGQLEHWDGDVVHEDYGVSNYYDVFGWGARRQDWRSYDTDERMACNAQQCDYDIEVVVDHMHDGQSSTIGDGYTADETWGPVASSYPPSAYQCGVSWLGDEDERIVENRIEVDCGGGGTARVDRSWESQWEREFGLAADGTTSVTRTESFGETDQVARRTELATYAGQVIYAAPISVELNDDDTIEFEADLSVWARHSIPECAADFKPQLTAYVFTQENGETTTLATIDLSRPGFALGSGRPGEVYGALPGQICADPYCQHPYLHYTGKKTIKMAADTIVVPSRSRTIRAYLERYGSVRVQLHDAELVHPVSTNLLTQTKYTECDVSCKRDMDTLTGDCCLITWGSRWGHSSLECGNYGSDYYTYISKHPSGNFYHSDAKWQCLWQDYRESMPVRWDCNSCLDLAKVSEWLCDHMDDSYDAFSSWCADATLEAIAYALPPEAPPTCPTPTPIEKLRGCRYVPRDIVGDPLAGVTMPGDAEEVMTRLRDNGCSRYDGCRLECLL